MTAAAERSQTIRNALGLHARAAAQLVKVTNAYRCQVTLECEGQSVNGKSIMGVLMLAAAQGMSVKISCKGEDAQACLDELCQLIENRFGEAQ